MTDNSYNLFMSERLVGGHVSIAGGVLNAFENASEIGANFMQIFTQSPRMWRNTAISEDDITRFGDALATSLHGVRGLVTHASYLINLASDLTDLKKKSAEALVHNLAAATQLRARGMVLHVGSHKGAGFDDVLPQIAATLDRALSEVEGPCPILIENTAGQGNSVGVTFEEIARIFEGVENSARLGVCIDTQHLFASGVSYGSFEEADRIADRFISLFGREALGCIHLNDSKVPLGSQRDRHENLGHGKIGEQALSRLMTAPGFSTVPIILEVPGEGKGPRKSDIDKAREILAKGTEARGH